MTKILAFVDGSIYAQSVLDHSVWAAKALEAEVDVIHVLGRREVASTPANYSGNLEAGAHMALLNELVDLDSQRAKLAQQRGRLILDEARAKLTDAGIGEVSGKLRNGDIVEAVQELEADARVILIGKRGEAADFAKLHLGSNLERVVRVSTKPVIVASRAFKPIKRFMIAFDGGPSVMKAINHIATGKLFVDLPCDLVMVADDNPDNRGKAEAAASVLRKGGYDVSVHIKSGEPEKVISDHVESQPIDLLVMGAYGHSRIRNLIIGSTTTEMIRLCKIPVMLFR